MVPVNYFAILVAAISSMVLGFFWYGPLFGKEWARLNGWKYSDIEKKQKEMGSGAMKMYGLQFLGSLFMAFVLAHALTFAKAYLGTSGISAGVQTGFWNWIGFVAPVTLGTVLWEGKPWKLWFLNNGYNLSLLLLMGVILALWA